MFRTATNTTKYLPRGMKILKGQVKGQNKNVAINIYTLSIIRYSAGIITWLRRKYKPKIKIRNFLTMHSVSS